ncbi:MAG: aldehyde ferredoxin oxidoreductase family protein [Chloroflexota bacterium]|nr:aldehyde ferredoxin oxidoreductase family protein [Chloroflexota bacterium]
MARGYMGNILDVNLTTGQIEEEELDEQLRRNYIGGYGIGARLLYERMPAGADPLGPRNILGILTGPCTGTQALVGSRFTVVGKSPKTGTWGDANSGGQFGPALKSAGFDGVFFFGISEKPVYLMVDGGKAELHDAKHLWGLNVSELEDTLKAELGDDIQVASIGTAGEKLSLMAAIMTDKGRAAARSGLGAVMGSKRLKAVVARGRQKVEVADEVQLRRLRQKYLREMPKDDFFDTLRDYGTSGITAESAQSGDSPVKNWGGAGTVDFPPEMAKRISDDSVIAYQQKRYPCWGCPIGCGGIMKLDKGRYALQVEKDHTGHKPEYETLSMFGTNILNDNPESVIRFNEICNDYGLDTISVGATLAFATECYEKGLINAEDTGGIELTWGNSEALIQMAELIARREGFGEMLADGVKVASEKLGPETKPYAIHIHGEEVPAHDPRFTPGLAPTYLLDATPARHTQGGELQPPPGLDVGQEDKYVYIGRAYDHYREWTSVHVLNAAGLCLFGYLSFQVQSLPEQLTAVTGWEFDLEEVYRTGMRIGTIRHAFNLREGHNPLTRNVPDRIIGDPPLAEGNVRGVTVDHETMLREFLEYVDWDLQTTVPSEESLRELGLEFLIKDMARAQVPAV